MNSENQPKGVSKSVPSVLVGGDSVNFVGVYEDLTFGARNGKSFVTANTDDWPPDKRVEWALAGAMFFTSLAARLTCYAELVEKENAQS